MPACRAFFFALNFDSCEIRYKRGTIYQLPAQRWLVLIRAKTIMPLFPFFSSHVYHNLNPPFILRHNSVAC
jgi:hypothetical protein